MIESPYIKRIKSKSLEAEQQYIHDVEMLRSIVRQSERTRNYGSSELFVNKQERVRL